MAGASREHFEVVSFDDHFLEKTWLWLQDPELRRLIRAPEFSRAEQQQWYRSLDRRSDYLIRGFLLSGSPGGVIGLKHLEAEDAEYFAYIGGSENRGKGIGRLMHESICDIARRIGLIRLWGVTNNEISLRAHLSYGWQICGKNEDGNPIIEFKLEGTP